MFSSFDPAQWHKQLMDRMEQYVDQINDRGKQKLDKVKHITAEGRVSTPHCKDSVCSEFKNEAIQRLLAPSQQVEEMLIKYIQSADQTTPYVEETLQKLFTEGFNKNVDEKCNKLSGDGSPLGDKQIDKESALCVETNDITKLDELVSLSLVGHSLSKYISMLPDHHRKHILAAIASQTVDWISQIFRFPNASGKLHNDLLEGLAILCRRLILHKFPEFETLGFEVFCKSTPVIYMGESVKSSIGHQLCVQLGLPLSSLCSIPCNTKLEGSETMDLDSLSDLITKDIKAERIPIAVVACAGTPLLGHIDNFLRLQEICQEKKIWLHAIGSNLSQVCLLEPPNNIATATVCSSMTLNIGAWLSLPGVSYVTLFRTPKELCPLDISMDNATATCDLSSSLSLWLALQHLGHDGMSARIIHSIKLSSRLRDKLKAVSSIELIPSPKRRRDNSAQQTNILSTLVSKVFSFFISSCSNSTVVFRYKSINKGDSSTTVSVDHSTIEACSTTVSVDHSTKDDSSTTVSGDHSTKDDFSTTVSVDHSTADDSSTTAISVDDNANDHASIDDNCSLDCYQNKINVWLCDHLNSNSTNVIIKPVFLKDGSTWMKFAPLDDNCFLYDVKESDIDAVVERISSQQPVLDSCLAMNQLLVSAVRSYCNLQVVKSMNAFNWQGVGAVRCLTSDWLYQSTIGSSYDVAKLNAFNESVVDRVHFNLHQLSLDRSTSDQWSIVLGVVTDESTLNDLLSNISAAGFELEELEKKRESERQVAEIITSNIQKASAELHDEWLTQSQNRRKSESQVAEIIASNIQKASAELYDEWLAQSQNQSLVRNIPLIGPLVGWLSPSTNTCNGRTFLLSSGVLVKSDPHRSPFTVDNEAESG